MMEKFEPVRRSRRAASLTAQVLWNLQIEEDVKGVDGAGTAKLFFNPSILKETDSASTQTEKPRKGRKRKISDKTQTQQFLLDSSDTDSNLKKPRLPTEYSGSVTAVIRRLPSETLRTNGKLTASVAPLVKSQPALSKSPTLPPSNPKSAAPNPILLLPVSLQANQNASQTFSGNVSGLSLLTLQASPDIFNCFGLNKPDVDTDHTQKQWDTANCHTRDIRSALNQFNFRNGSVGMATSANQCVTSCNGFKKPQKTQIDEITQVEPLNLKMGETKIPSSKLIQQVKLAPSLELDFSEEKRHENFPSPATSTLSNSSNVTFSQSQKRNNRISPITIQSLAPSKTENEKKWKVTSPTPDFSCSSPDIDDVHMVSNRSCQRQHIDLRHKAASLPESLEYEKAVEVQRRLLADIKKAHKTKTKAKIALKRSKSRSKSVNKKRLSSSSKPSTSPSLEESNNGWTWVGKPYSSSVFSLASGKHVQRCCYPGITRQNKTNKSLVLVRDCIVLQPSGENELPYIGKVSALWEKPRTREMMLSLVWYYRPEHTEGPKLTNVSDDELFVSRHQDEISVACIEDRCHVLTYQQFCRAQAKLHRDGQWEKNDIRNIVPHAEHSDANRLSPSEGLRLEPSEMFFCRHFYDAAQKKVKTKLPLPTSLRQDHKHRNSVSSM